MAASANDSQLAADTATVGSQNAQSIAASTLASINSEMSKVGVNFEDLGVPEI